MHEATLYERLGECAVRCGLCRHNCTIADGNAGICGVRENSGGRLYSIFYGHPLAMASDPIEKKPLFHFKPASQTFSIACAGCNFKCKFCQNFEISQYSKNAFQGTSEAEISPIEIVAHAKREKCASVSFTYTEPTVFFEYALACADVAKKIDLANIFVTNGFMSRAAIDKMALLIDAANVDLKAFSEKTYKKVIGGELQGVLDSIAYLREKKVWLEITTLVVPDLNDSTKELQGIAEFIAKTGNEIPWHISRFTPRYKMDKGEQTPIATLSRAYEIGKKAGLKYVYIGNASVAGSENTACYACGRTLIERRGFAVTKNRLVKKNRCPDCGASMDGVF